MLSDRLDLAHWRRSIAELYAEVRRLDPGDGWQRWRAVRDEMLATHPQSPLDEPRRRAFTALTYFPYDPEARVLAAVEEAEPQSFEIPTSGTEPMRFTRVGTARFELYGHAASLELFWLDSYAGGLFLSFRDATSGTETYGAGRYLLDTIKGADLGMEGDRLVLDFNYAYNPSCSYDPRWVCPLAPPANRLAFPVRAGERMSG